MEPAIPTGQEILEQLNQLAGEYALSGNNSTVGGGLESRTNAGDSRQESSSSAEDGAESSEKVVDDNNVMTPHHPVTPPRPVAPTPAPAPAPAPSSPLLALPSVGPTIAPPSASPSVVEAPISSRLRVRHEKSQKWKASMGIVPEQDQGQAKKRKAPKETVEPAKRAKTVAKNTTTTKTAKKVAAHSAGAQPRKNKQKTSLNSSMFIILLQFYVAMTTTTES